MRNAAAECKCLLEGGTVGVGILLCVLLGVAGCSSDKKSTIPIDPTILETDKDFLPAWSPDGKTVAYFTVLYDTLSFQTSLRTVSIATDSVRIIREFGTLDVHGLDWSPEGEWLVFSSVLGLHKIHKSGDSLSQLTVGESQTSPSWSATRNLIFFSAPGSRGLHSITPMGSDFHQWPWSDHSGIAFPSCFPAGDSLSVYTIQNSRYCIAVQYPEDTLITTILECGFSWLESSRVSPDQSLIAFNAAYPGDPESNLYLFSRSSQSLEKLNSKASEGMDFSPDGTRLVHADLGVVYDEPRLADRRGSRGLQIINLADRSVRQLTPGYQ